MAVILLHWVDIISVTSWVNTK